MRCLFLLTVFSPIILCEDVQNSLQNHPISAIVNLTTPQIIRKHGYTAETHHVVTEDGYILTLHRIPGPRPVTGKNENQPVFLQHGILSSSADWVIAGNESLALMLADAGYDVWLGNARGNTYSTAHVNLSVESAQYWNFSWHEMGYYDLPAAISYVSNMTKKPGEIIYVGHSMGATMFFVFAATRPQNAKNVKMMAALAPVAYMAYVKSPLKYLTPFTYFEWLAKYLGVNQFSPNSKIIKILSYDCKLMRTDEDLCDNLLLILCGFNKSEFKMELLPMVLNHDRTGTSTKMILHYSQEIQNEGKFQQYDYGRKENMIKYGNVTPPEYNLGNIEVKTYIMYAQDDMMASHTDVLRLSQVLPNNIGLYKVPLDIFDHGAFLFGRHAAELVYKPLIEVIENCTEVVY